MFRIKNVRNATVGKPSNIPTLARKIPPQSPSLNKPNPTVKTIAQPTGRLLPTRQLVRRNESSKPKRAVIQSKITSLRPSGFITKKVVEPSRVVRNVP